MRVLITGPQGSGKTTQSELLAEYLGVSLIDTGEMLRSFAEKNSDQGREIKERMTRGEMAPNQLAADLVKERLQNEDSQRGFVMDGYPRSLEQLNLFDPEFNKVFYLQIEDDLVRERLKNRGRIDDTPEGIERRLNLYHQLTEKLLEKYKNEGKLVIIDGSKTIEQIQDQIKNNI